MRSCVHAFEIIGVGLVVMLAPSALAQDKCNWANSTITTTPQYQTSNSQQVCLTLRSTCPTNSLYDTFVIGATVVQIYIVELI